jgi:hypothetical protein
MTGKLGRGARLREDKALFLRLDISDVLFDLIKSLLSHLSEIVLFVSAI